MKLLFFNNTYDYFGQDNNPQLFIRWLYYNHKPTDTYIQKRNRTRKKIGLPQIIDDGAYFTITFGILGMYFGFDLQIRPVVLEKTTPRA